MMRLSHARAYSTADNPQAKNGGKKERKKKKNSFGIIPLGCNVCTRSLVYEESKLLSGSTTQ